jgi:cytochrome c5|tara:strand:+ start:212 stop:604 length:393 start_codon:yes stop_codon:yes gene_type:complete
VKLKTLLAMGAAFFAVFAVNAQQMSNDAIKDRIKPVGAVHIAGAAAAAPAGALSGEDVYNKACVACHGAGVLGAPRLQNAADWKPRLEQGFDTVLSHAINGFNAMPPRGTCGTCSDDDIKAAIEYMIEGV